MPLWRSASQAKALAAIAVVALLIARPVHAQNWRIEAGLGSVHKFRTPLTIDQAGSPAIELTARYATRGFEIPFYYAVRVERSWNNTSWGVEFIHDKLYLENRPPEVQLFNSTHGFNMLSVVRTKSGSLLGYRLGVGALLAHVENEVRGRKLPENGGISGYHLTGPVLQAGLLARKRVIGNTSVFGDARLMGGRARFPVEGGHARFWNAGLHFSAGLSQQF